MECYLIYKSEAFVQLFDCINISQVLCLCGNDNNELSTALEYCASVVCSALIYWLIKWRQVRSAEGNSALFFLSCDCLFSLT